MSEVGIEAVRSRVDALAARMDGREGPRELGSIAEFDAFGDAYQAAIDRKERAGLGGVGGFGASLTTQIGRSGFATAVPSGLGSVSGPDRETILAAITGTAGHAGVRPVGGYGSMPVPDELRGFGNGKIPAEALTEISQGNHRLYAPAAAAWNSVVAAAKTDGIDLRITDSYRSYDQQVDLVRRKGLYSQGGLGATPGTSNHGWGLAVDADVTDARTREWLQHNGPRFGWVESVPREPWHWEFRPHQV